MLVLGIFSALVAIGFFDLYRVWQSNQVQLKDSLKKRTEIAALAFEQWSKAQQEPLATLAEVIEDKPIRSVIVDSNLLYLLDTRASWLNLQIADDKGKILSNYTKGREIPQSLIDDLQKKLKENNSWTFTTDRTESEERPIFTIATPLKDGGAVIAQIDGESVKELFNDIELGENSVVAIHDANGQILYRRSGGETIFYSEIVSSPLIEALGDKKITVAEIESPYDGLERVYGLARTSRSENVVVIGIPSRRFYEPLWNQIYRQLRVSLIILLIAVGITLFFAYGILKSLKNLKDATYRFAAGNREAKAPTNIAGEIGELGKAFNAMAEQINEREDRLKELDELKSEFVSSVSHELRTPLTTIKTLAHVLRENKASKAEQAEYLEVIAAECDRQIILVSNILDVSLIESGKLKYETSEIDLEKVLQDVYQIEKPAVQLNANDLKLQIPENLLAVQANNEALHRVFRSLIENAVKYNSENGTILISAQNLENSVAVNISDKGCGIASADLPRIFEKFYRGTAASEDFDKGKESGGVGLGLYITKKIVEQLDGKITAANNQDGGMMFTVNLPVWQGGENGKKTFIS